PLCGVRNVKKKSQKRTTKRRPRPPLTVPKKRGLEIPARFGSSGFLNCASKAFSLAANGGNSAANTIAALLHKIARRTRQITRALRKIVAGIFPAHGSEKDSQPDANSQTCQKGLHSYAPAGFPPEWIFWSS